MFTCSPSSLQPCSHIKILHWRQWHQPLCPEGISPTMLIQSHFCTVALVGNRLKTFRNTSSWWDIYMKILVNQNCMRGSDLKRLNSGICDHASCRDFRAANFTFPSSFLKVEVCLVLSIPSQVYHPYTCALCFKASPSHRLQTLMSASFVSNLLTGVAYQDRLYN